MESGENDSLVEAKPAGRRAREAPAESTVGIGAWVEGALTSGTGIGAICRPLTAKLSVEARTRPFEPPPRFTRSTGSPSAYTT
jgi:hypothetical protein